MRGALHDAAPAYHSAEEAQAHRAEGRGRALAFIAEALPEMPPDQWALNADLLLMTLESVGKRASVKDWSPAEADAFGEAFAGMLCAWLDQLRKDQAANARRTIPPD